MPGSDVYQQVPGDCYALPREMGATAKGGRLCARFVEGRYTTGDKQVIDYLRSHPDYGISLTEAD